MRVLWDGSGAARAGGAEDSLGGDEGVVFNGVEDVQELDLGGERVAVVDDGQVVWSVPAVHLRVREKRFSKIMNIIFNTIIKKIE